MCDLASVAALRPLLVVEHETDAATFRDQRRHELSDGLEHGFEPSVVLGFGAASLRDSSLFEAMASRSRTKARMISMLTAMARELRRIEDNMATPCSVKA